ncbi:hypothetical protein DICPUDRAFT_33863 [Dictyostelium purpureum]|uniref:3-hydroxyisobutyryl-CoA hydrolase n=1 Tax=Dictyostelium purpureum TaxID=5786 RepID=F0ZLP9_DICPU|nr:uncharacterized protein DICPUDRAFT_33863 [Dictyostelium purpureum]EGC35152.1 hypothetical protein DICPUDRAFT_33863 [Dictyostelium purpureum]|eukprot:XP_003288345.1 hypothetical protein DICPUDRAFT_33863 [Dictyostelium purpureum]
MFRAINLTSKNVRYFTTSTEEVLFDKKGKCLNVLLNRPKALNALNPGMVKLLTPKYQEMKNMKDGDMVLIMKGSGEKAFCAGGDIKAIYDYKKGVAPSTENIGDLFFREEYILNNLIGTNPIPQVSIYNGFAMGGGVGLSVHGKFRVATDTTVFAMPETAIGFFCDVGGSHFLPKLKHNYGMYLALTGNKLKGKNVLASGVATHFISNERIKDVESALENLSNPTHENVKKVLDQVCDKIDVNDSSLEFNQNLETIERIFGKSSVEEIFDSLEKENTEWSKQTLKTLKTVSPTSLKVVFEQMNQGKKLPSLAKCLEMEFRISQHFLEKPDFFEGVRALLVDKDKNPKWNPSSIDQVSDDLVKSYFAPLKSDQELKL